MPLPAAIAGLAVPAAKALATYAAMVGTDYVINKGAGDAINFAERVTRKKGYRRGHKVARALQKGYYGPGGQLAKGFASFAAGSALASRAKASKKKAKIAKKLQRTRAATQAAASMADFQQL